MEEKRVTRAEWPDEAKRLAREGFVIRNMKSVDRMDPDADLIVLFEQGVEIR